MQRDEMQKRRRDVMVACPFILPDHLLLGVVACPFILPGHLLLGVVRFCDMTALLLRHERGER